ncbi:SDR family NAD(P)-dependent oxidoreductase [Streptomyces mirabilis]|uniref:SDR family NAD(P)-dependent oxidoreductase n=1 Tax=Streptomyces mirabilis TaxID=68239 RepID=UPI00379FFB20
MGTLDSKIALVTGSTGGIGGETARLMAREGAEVIVSGRNTEHGTAAVRAIADEGGSARFVPADLTDLASLRRLADAAGAVDILVNNAAVFPMGPTVGQDVESFDHSLAANIRAPYFLTAALVPGMIGRGGGSIVNISSMTASLGLPGLSVYSATKAALESLTRTWAAEFAPAGVRVNGVSPGPTGSDNVIAQMGKEALEQFATTTLLQRFAEPREIAEVILFLASDRSSYMTGATIAVDAGRTAV